MRVGVPREVKPGERRVALTPSGAAELVRHGHEVLLQAGAGLGSRIPDEEFRAVGARVVPDAAAAWSADLVLKVKEPTPSEYGYLRGDLTLFTYLHLAADPGGTDALLSAGTTGLAYETVEAADGTLPLLTPMSEVAGRMAPMVAATLLMHGAHGSDGRGVLMSGVSGVPAARVVVLGAGTAGVSAAAIAAGMHADVTVLDRDVRPLRALDQQYQGHLRTVISNRHEVEQAVLEADVVVGAVLVHGARTPVLVDDELVARMRPGSVIVDISVDQGGCVEGARPTTHQDPTFAMHESVFYGVSNMPGAVPRTATYALANVTLPYAVAVADNGWREAARDDPSLALGVITAGGAVVSAPVAEAHGIALTPLSEVLR